METIASGDKTLIAYEATGEGPPLVLVHGGTADHTRWRTVAPLLEQHASLYAIDRRGRGGSGEGSDYTIDREFADVAAVVEQVAQRTGGPVDLFGHSFGAVCALGGARLAAGSLRRLVLYEPPLGPEAAGAITPGIAERLEDLLAQGRRDELIETFFRDEAKVPPHEVEVLRSLPAWQGRVAAAHTIPRELRAVAAFDPTLEWFAAVRVPTLLLLGGDSPAVYAAATALVHRALPDARVQILPGQQHVAMDTAPDLLTRHVLDFLGGTDR